MADNIVTPSPQNSVLTSVQQFSDILGGLLQSGANAYSNFKGANTAAKIAKNQSSNYTDKPTSGDINAINALRENQGTIVTYAAIALAIGGTVYLVMKALK